ncbi:hypothetical protein BJX68DRAFT_191502 [Aspergillus pseudodeflectus]|uniref:Uncharacterized protein n=1 Tax=Aspergillus pseudodeflectus TaxID=176178 RepID=A0ABR4KYA2_9EURO
MDISESQATTLLKAIDLATEERVRDVLRLLCKVSPDAQRIAAEELLVDASKKREAGDTNLEDNSEAETDSLIVDLRVRRTRRLSTWGVPLRRERKPPQEAQVELYRLFLSHHGQRDSFRDTHSARTVRRSSTSRRINVTPARTILSTASRRATTCGWTMSSASRIHPTCEDDTRTATNSNAAERYWRITRRAARRDGMRKAHMSHR